MRHAEISIHLTPFVDALAATGRTLFGTHRANVGHAQFSSSTCLVCDCKSRISGIKTGTSFCAIFAHAPTQVPIELVQMSDEPRNVLRITLPASPNVTPASNRPAQSRAAQLATERDGNLPVWVRAPKRGQEFYSGCSRPKLYEWAGKGFIRSVSIRKPGRITGVRLFHLASILAFIERCEAGVLTEETNRRTR